MFFHSLRQFKRIVPINCRNPAPGSTDLTFREKRDWAIFIAIITVIPVGLMWKQFDVTSSIRVNQDIDVERSRRTSGTV